MDQITARKLVKDTLQNPFDRAKFQYLLKNLLNHFEDSAFIYRGGTIPEAYRDYVVTFERIGKYQDLDDNKIDILAVYLKKNFSLENARTMQRNLVAWYLNGSRGDVLKDAALVAFIAPNGEDWRFSLVKMEYKITETPSGKVKAKEELTPARRHSFLVGIHEDSHTAQSQLVPILCDDTNDPSLEQLEGAFNIEKVTKEFFEKYHSLFLNLKENLDLIVEKDSTIKKDFESKNVNTIDFAKKLLGQIVFLYFLQKKGWFGVARDESWGTGPRDFLRRLFEKKISDYSNFFNDILEPLFYEALAVERSDNFYSRFNCNIPFLNGGLFDPISAYDWVHTDICLPNNLFSNDEPTKEGDKGTGILDVFDRYNFTVKEDEPLEKEVAVDPEMLGKVFENLLEVKDRKSKGTYYTPREIVHYMCQESLINYLVTECEGKVNNEEIETLIKYGETAVEHDGRVIKEGRETEVYSFKIPERVRDNAAFIDEKLKNIRVCDPAIGSGAFPVGMMNEIVRTRNALSNYIHGQLGRSIYNFKRHVIQSCLYGVDIDAGAVEIAKLRLWLSLVVDEEDIHEIKPLPNLDYKIMQGNSLIELFSPNLTGYGADTERNELIDELNSCRREFFNATSQSEKTRLRLAVNEQIRNIVNYDKNQKISRIKNKLEGFRGQEKLFTLEGENLSLVDVSETKEETTLSKELKELENVEQMSPEKHFEWHLNFNEVFNEKGGFDIVIANPPYIGEKGHKEIFNEIKRSNLGRFYFGKIDIFYLFFHLAFDLGKDMGNVAFITTNYYITADGAKKLRQDFKERTIIRNLINFNELKIFKSALGQHNMLTLLTKTQNKNYNAENLITKRSGIATPQILQDILSGRDQETSYFTVSQNDLYEGDENYIRLYGVTASGVVGIQPILDKIKNSGEKLETYCNVNIGMRTGADKVTPEYIQKYNLKAQNGEGIFIITKSEKELLNLNEYELCLLLPLFKNSDIQRFHCKANNDLFLIDLSYPKNKNIDFNSIPNLLKHVKKYETVLKNRRSNDNGLLAVIKSGYWWAYTMRQLDFSKPKIISPQRSKFNTFAYNEIPWYASMDVYFITEKNSELSLKYILSLLNSKLYFQWLYQRGKRKGDTLELYQKPLSEIPVKKISSDEQKPFIEIVDKILAITKSENYLHDQEGLAKVKEYEKQIDQMVYKLYELTQEEIEIVEGS